MSDGLKHGEGDARVWAREFMRITGGSVDEDAMVGWFANAIMSGWDSHYWTTPEYKALVSRVMTPQEATE